MNSYQLEMIQNIAGNVIAATCVSNSPLKKRIANKFISIQSIRCNRANAERNEEKYRNDCERKPKCWCIDASPTVPPTPSSDPSHCRLEQQQCAIAMGLLDDEVHCRSHRPAACQLTESIAPALDDRRVEKLNWNRCHCLWSVDETVAQSMTIFVAFN